MGYAVELFFDSQSENKIKGYYELLYQTGLAEELYKLDSRPHISLAVYNELPESFIDTLSIFASGIEKIKLHFVSMGLFPGSSAVIFLSPVVNKNLLNLHNKFHIVMEDFRKYEWEYYLPGKWVPHCTLAIDYPQVNTTRILQEIADNFEPFQFTIESIGLVEFRPVKLLNLVNLKS